MPRGPGPLGNQVERLIQGLLDPGKGLVNPRRYKKPGRKSGYKNPIMQEARRLYDAAGGKASGRPWTSFVKLAATRVPKVAKRLKPRRYPRTQSTFELFQPRVGFIGENPPVSAMEQELADLEEAIGAPAPEPIAHNFPAVWPAGPAPTATWNLGEGRPRRKAARIGAKYNSKNAARKRIERLANVVEKRRNPLNNPIII